MVELTVNEIAEGKRLKSYIGEIYPNLKRSALLKALQGGDIKVNGERQKRNVELNRGDVIRIYLPDDQLGVQPPLDFVYEDENLMIINKKPGISSFDDKNNGAPNILSMADAHMRSTGEYNPDILNIPYLVHRLDHYTGGLMVIAKHEPAYNALREAFAQRRIRKFYLAVVCGRVEPSVAAQLHDYLVKDAAASKVRIVNTPVKGAVPVVTRYRALRSTDEISLLEIELVTGRTHQIRAHMAYYGHPVLGDDKYGDRKMNKKYNASYQALWAHKLIFEIGTGHFMEYLNKKVFETQKIELPLSIQELF